MSAWAWLPIGVPILMAVLFPVLYFSLLAFLWQGARLFAEYRRRLAMALVCADCGRDVLVPGARFCGKCGGKLRRAA